MQPKCTGSSYTLEYSIPCFRDSSMQPIQSIYIFPGAGDSPKKGCIWIYRSYCHSGTPAEICADISDLSRIGYDNSIGSFRLGEGVKSIKVYKFKDYSKSGLIYSSDSISLFNSSMDKQIMSIKLVYP